jgi:hypothetical protein
MSTQSDLSSLFGLISTSNLRSMQRTLDGLKANTLKTNNISTLAAYCLVGVDLALCLGGFGLPFAEPRDKN